MSPLNLFWLFTSPIKGWRHLVHGKPTMHRLFLLHVIPFSLIPPLMIYFAIHQYGGHLLPALSGAKPMLVAAILFVVELAVVPVMGLIIRELAEVAEVEPSYREAFMLAAVAPTPLWLAPLFLFFPSVFINLIVVTLAMMAAGGLIYYGVPVVFQIKDKGHAILLFSAVLIAGVVAWGFLMVSTLVIWGSVQNLNLGAWLG